jgi:transglutaminase-like putative cysteine protease
MTLDLSPYLRPTPLLDFHAREIQSLVSERGWGALEPLRRVAAVHAFVRDEIPFGYNRTDSIPASVVLRDGHGQCNTKTTLLMALLRAAGVPCRLHGATIHKALQRGVVTGLFYWLAPSSILHSWAEAWFDGQWVGLEGVILDKPYLAGLTARLHQSRGPLLGYGVGTADIGRPAIDFEGGPTSIQMTGVNQDFGVFPDPDTGAGAGAAAPASTARPSRRL